MMISKKLKQLLAGFLCIMMMITCIPMNVSATETTGAEEAGSFVLAVFSQNVAVIEPIMVSYEEGDTVKDALANSGYAFEGIDSGFISSVEGVSGNYSMVYADGNFGLDVAADKVVTFFMSERTDVNVTTNPELVAAVSNALQVMAAYTEADNNVQNYPNAQTAYKTVLTNMRTGNAETIQSNTTALDDAVKEYEAFLAGEKRKVTVNVTQGGTSVTDAKLAFTDVYGNVTEATGNEIELLDGQYSFVVTDSHKPYNYTTNVGKMNNVGSWQLIENYFTVSEASTELHVKLADGEWFGEFSAETNASEALNHALTETDTTNHKMVYYVADNFNSSFKLTANKTEETPVKTTSGTLSSIDIRPWVDYVYLAGANAGKLVSDVATTANTNMASFASSRTCLNLITYGMQGNTLKSEIKWLDDSEEDATGHIVIQGYDIEVKRIPTLLKLDVKDSAGSSLISDYDAFTYDYNITTIADSFTVEAAPYDESYNVEVKAGEGTAVNNHTVILNDETGSFTVEVMTEDVASVYTVNLTKVNAVDVTLTMEEGVTAQVLNAGGSVIEPKTAGSSVYALVPEETYTYIGTSEEHYHTTAEFTATEGLSVAIATPEVKTVLSNFAIYDKSASSTRVAYEWDKAFADTEWNYTVQVPDVNTSVYIQADSSDSDYTYWTRYIQQYSSATYDGVLKDWTKVTPKAVAASSATNVSRLVAKSGYGNTLKLQVRKTSDTVTYYQEFVFELVRTLSMAALTASTERAGELVFTDGNGETLAFDRSVYEYTTKVSSETQELLLSGTFQNEKSAVGSDGGYSVEVNGTVYEDFSDIRVPLDINEAEETIEISILHKDTNAVSQTYKITVKKQQPINVTFHVTPDNAIVYIVNQLDSKTLYSDENGVFVMMPEVPYTYTVSAPGYKTVQVTDFELAEKTEGEENTETIEISLEEAPESIYTEFEAEWPSFRADSTGNGVISSKTPIKAEESVLYWANQIGEGFDSGATGCPIIIDGYLYTYAGGSIVKVDTISGEVVASGKMAGSSSFAINSPTYAAGMIFVGLSNGRVQAFNAETLESLWVYTDPLGGQPNCPIKYFDGHVYTGFWISETKPANFVCISVTDEDPAQQEEAKLASWRYTHNGFYWAGAYVCEDFVLVGTDDGDNGYTNGHASVLSFDTETGNLIDEMTLPGVGDLRSDIMFDEKGTGDYYFTTKGGHFYRLSVNDDGTFKNLMSIKLDNYTNNDSTPPMSTCTPVVYNGRAYIGVSGAGQFSAYSGHNITVIDLESWSIAYTVRTQGYPQTSGLLTTAYEEETELVYVYFIDNYTPGKIRVISDKKGQTAPNEVTQEAGYDTAYVLFTPSGEQAQFAICSPIADKNGVLYFKNDSAYMMALGPVIENIEVTQMPAKTKYAEGETFDAEGIQVIATYANGTTRDISEYISYSTEALTTQDNEFMIEFPYVMYQDKAGKVGVDYPAPFTTIALEITNGTEETTEKVCEVFPDVDHGAWYEEGVQYVYDKGIMGGSNGLFNPTGNITRAQVVTTLYNLEGRPAVTDYSAVDELVDVQADQWYTDAVCWAYSVGVASGNNVTKMFNMNSPVTRQQLATFFYNYAEYKGLDITTRGDISDMTGSDEVASYALETMQWAVGTGLITGSKTTDADGNTVYDLKPTGTATRAQMASILMRFSEFNDL